MTMSFNPPAKRTILIVEDDHDVRSSLCQLLSVEGYNAIPAANGLQALEILKNSELPSLILLDLMMPVMNGWQFCEEQQKDPKLKSIPVVIFTADGDPEEKTAHLKLAGVLRKPFLYDRLFETVAKFCK